MNFPKKEPFSRILCPPTISAMPAKKLRNLINLKTVCFAFVVGSVFLFVRLI